MDLLVEDAERVPHLVVFTERLGVIAGVHDHGALAGLRRTHVGEHLRQVLILLVDRILVKVFEIGTVFLAGKEIIYVAYGDKKNITEVTLDEFCIKNNLLISDSVSMDELIPNREGKKVFKPWSTYPFIVRDIAVWVPVENGELDVTNKLKLAKMYKEFGGELLNGEPILFDEFTKGDKTSVAYRLIFQSYEKTLTDDEVAPIMAKISEKISEFGWEVR